MLNQLTADATDRTVVTGPVEATAIGNVLMQAIGLGHLGSLAEAREVVRNSFDVEEYHPGDREGWDEAYAKIIRVDIDFFRLSSFLSIDERRKTKEKLC